MVEQLTLSVNLGDRTYPIVIGGTVDDALGEAVARLREDGRQMAVVTDDHVKTACAALFDGILADLPVLSVAAGEESKSLSCLGKIYDFLGGLKLDRKSVLIAVGGGVVGDLAGFAAASYLRGIDFLQVPTTLLAMVDSSVGGKTGINIGAGKNLVGAFHQPRAVFIGTALLATLPPREFAAGMAEVIKSGLLGDRQLYETVAERPVAHSADARLPGIIRRCCEIKAGIVQADERETSASGGRALLNLGHTFAHAIENVAGYGTYLHGEAVGIGLAAAAQLSQQLGYLNRSEAADIAETVAAHRLLVTLREPLPLAELMAAMYSDKKTTGGRLRFVVMETLGKAATRDGIDDALVREIWRQVGAA